MAFVGFSKIRRDVLRNSSRLFSFKYEMTPAHRLSTEPVEAIKENVTRNLRYNMYQPRATPAGKTTVDLSSQRKNAKTTIDQQNLQPSKLPEYYKQQMQRSAIVTPGPDFNEELLINKATQRFQVSNTCANTNLPLKSLKLASPFPEPVKMVMSRTISDDEKAAQMLADSRCQRNFSDWSVKPGSATFRSFSTSMQRYFCKASETNKCKKAAKKKGGCPKMILQGCPPRARQNCKREPLINDCRKQEAPYPAYSEFCHEDLEEKPSECKMCPWRPEENPNFKPQKKRFHSFSLPLHFRRSGLEKAPEEVETQKEVNLSSQETEPSEPEMKCDMRKPPCEQPNVNPCPPGTTKKEIDKAKNEKKKDKPKKKLSQLIEEEIFVTPVEESLICLQRGCRQDEVKKEKVCKIKKFKFPQCNVTRQQKEEETGCPKKKKSKIEDCPNTDAKCISSFDNNFAFSLNDSVKKDQKKCPKVDMTIAKEEEEKDRCKKKKKNQGENCPENVLNRYKRCPTKKSETNIQPSKSV